MSPVQEYVQTQRQLLTQEQEQLLQQYDSRYFFDYLFDLATIFEAFYIVKEDNPDHVQIDNEVLAKLVFQIMTSRNFTKDQREVEKIQQKWKGKMQRQAKKGWGQDLPLIRLFQNALQLRMLEELEDVDRNDHSRRASIEAGEPKIEVTNPTLWQQEQITAQKYAWEITFYRQLGYELAQAIVSEEQIVLPGLTAFDAELSFEIIGWELAAGAYLDHYGIEEEFTWRGQTLQRTILLRIIALWVVYYQGRYDLFFTTAIHLGLDVPNSIHAAMKELEPVIKEPLGPLAVLEWNDLLSRLRNAFRNTVSTKVLARHLKFFIPNATTKEKDFSLFQTPLLKQGDKAVLFLRPLMGQNVWSPIVQELIGNKKENHRISAATEQLGELFKPHDFSILVDEKIYQADGKNLITDIDIAALKNGHLFLFEMKMTRPRTNAEAYRNHIKTLFGKACEQHEKVLLYLRDNWEAFRKKLATTLPWEDITIHRIILSSSFEVDRSTELLEKGFLKISMFELERYLRNDAALMFDEDKAEPVPELQGRFYPAGEQLSGKRLWELIEKNRLWAFLEE